MTKYSVKIASENEMAAVSFPVASKTAEGARKQARKIAREHPDKQVFCAFDRSTDGHHVYINEDGASPTAGTY